MTDTFEQEGYIQEIEEGRILDNLHLLELHFVDPSQPQLVGIKEIWGESQHASSAKGDLVILKTIRQFNEKYGGEK